MDKIFMNTFFCIFLVIFVKILVNYITKGKKKLPQGPPALLILGHLHLINQPLHQALEKISKQYGPAVFLRFGSVPVLVISDHTLALKCFTTHDLVFSNRFQLPTVKMQVGLIGFANYGIYWRTVRQAAVHELLSSQKVQASSQLRAQENRGMACQLFRSYKLHNESEESNSFIILNINKMLFELVMDTFLMMIMGKRAYGENIGASDDIKK